MQPFHAMGSLFKTDPKDQDKKPDFPTGKCWLGHGFPFALPYGISRFYFWLWHFGSDS